MYKSIKVMSVKVLLRYECNLITVSWSCSMAIKTYGSGMSIQRYTMDSDEFIFPYERYNF
jgi:hypothetical protein